jgi:ribosomal protein S18 acetylase RimI-like enzyme
MIVQADASHIDAAWSIIDRSRAALLNRGILQWEQSYPSRDNVVHDVDRGTLYALISAGVMQAVVTLDDNQPPEYATVAWTGSEPALVVHRLCVDPESQGRGLGNQLMAFGEAHASEHGYASIRLDCYTENPQSISLYRGRGYREAGQVYFPRRSLPFYCFELPVRASRNP